MRQAEQHQAQVAQLQAQLSEASNNSAVVQREHEDLLVYLAEQDLEAKKYRARLRELGDAIPVSDDEDDDGGPGV
jgi:hypothetical protein